MTGIASGGFQLPRQKLVNDQGEAAVGLGGGDLFGVGLDVGFGVTHGEAEGSAAASGGATTAEEEG